MPAYVALSDNYIFVSSRREDGGSTRPAGVGGDVGREGGLPF